MESLDEQIFLHQQNCKKLFEDLEKNKNYNTQRDINNKIKNELDFIESLNKIKFELGKKSEDSISNNTEKKKENNSEKDKNLETRDLINNNSFKFDKRPNNIKKNKNKGFNKNTNHINIELKLIEANPLIDKIFKYYFEDLEIESTFYFCN